MKRLLSGNRRDFSLIEVVTALDQAIQELNALREAFENLRAYAEFERLKDEVKRLEKKIIKQGDLLLSYRTAKES